jgi:hypothetical protein
MFQFLCAGFFWGFVTSFWEDVCRSDLVRLAYGAFFQGFGSMLAHGEFGVSLSWVCTCGFEMGFLFGLSLCSAWLVMPILCTFHCFVMDYPGFLETKWLVD